MNIKEALAKELRINCPRCKGTGDGSLSKTARCCYLCHSSGKLLLPSDDLEEIIVALRQEISEISKMARFTSKPSSQILNDLLGRESLQR